MTINAIDQPEALIKTRFAPSPTGFMHIGNLRTALFSYLFAKSQGGKFFLRIEDTDLLRSKQIYIDALLKELSILGLNWDQEVVYQSTRTAIYAKYYTQLIEKDLIYRCFCSEEELSLARKVQLAQGLPPRYAGTCLQLSKEQLAQKLADQQPACWRFKVPKGIKIEFIDLIKGQQTFQSSDFGDFVVQRQDGSPAFMFCSVLDDVLQGVTHVLRGEDHVSNTPRQLLILQALNLVPPLYGHFPLLLNSGESELKLSKRAGSQSIRELLAAGFLPAGLINYLARLGHNYPTQGNHLLSLVELAASFKLEQISTNPGRHDLAHLNFWQKQAMLSITNAQLLAILQATPEFTQILNSYPAQLEAFLTLMKDNILMPNEALGWATALFADSWSKLEIPADLNSYLKTLDLELLTSLAKIENFEVDCAKLKALGFKAKDLFMAIRLILTGRPAGPELVKLFAIVGAARFKARTQEVINYVKDL